MTHNTVRLDVGRKSPHKATVRRFETIHTHIHTHVRIRSRLSLPRSDMNTTQQRKNEGHGRCECLTAQADSDGHSLQPNAPKKTTWRSCARPWLLSRRIDSTARAVSPPHLKKARGRHTCMNTFRTCRKPLHEAPPQPLPQQQPRSYPVPWPHPEDCEGGACSAKQGPRLCSWLPSTSAAMCNRGGTTRSSHLPVTATTRHNDKGEARTHARKNAASDKGTRLATRVELRLGVGMCGGLRVGGVRTIARAPTFMVLRCCTSASFRFSSCWT